MLLVFQIPNYAVPENRVLPLGAGGELPNKRQLLRPVSQELTKFHPEFADIFQNNDDGSESMHGSDHSSMEGKENRRASVNLPMNSTNVNG